MSEANLFGPFLDSQDLELAVVAFLKKWMPTYIGELRRLRDPAEERWPDGIAEIRSYGVDVDELGQRKWPEDQLPAIVVGSAGEDSDPLIEGDGRVTALFRLGILAVAEGIDEADSKALARLYAGAARWAIGQRPHLDGFAIGVELKPGVNDVISRGVEASRSLAGCAYPFVVGVGSAMNVMEGPDEPLENPEDDPGPRGKVKADGAHLEVRPGKRAVEELQENGHFD